MPRRVKAILVPDLFFDLRDFRGKELNGSAALGTYHVMVAAAVELVLKASGSIRERNHAGQPAFRQQLERAIYRSESDLGVFLPHQAEQLVRGKMIARLQERA